MRPGIEALAGLDLHAVLDEIAVEVASVVGHGQVADYIPPLARVPADRFAMAVLTVDGQGYEVGDARRRFSIQSISKLFSFTQAFRLVGDELWRRVGREPSGNPFNSLVQLEHEHGIPRNPFINAGALVVADVILDHPDLGRDPVGDFLRWVAGLEHLTVDEEVAAAEIATGHRNRALAAFIKSFGNLHNEVEAVLELYTRHCAVEMNVAELARSVQFLAAGGVEPWTGRRVVSASQAKRINAVLLTCGTYDTVGDFAFRVGLPGKSGVGGGIVALIPDVLTVAVWSPGLNPSGNSLAGTLALELFTTKTGISIF